jgi:hypothetical protein
MFTGTDCSFVAFAQEQLGDSAKEVTPHNVCKNSGISSHLEDGRLWTNRIFTIGHKNMRLLKIKRLNC